MGTEILVDGLALKLKTDGPLSLLVRDQPVVAIFEHPTAQKNDSLGQVTDRNQSSDILRLSIGVNQQTRELLITLTIRIRAKRSRNKSIEKGRLMFLVVPAESLALNCACNEYDALVKQFPGIVFESPSDDKSGQYKLMRMCFDIGSMRSYVIMPQYRRQANATDQQMALLRKLKSLSESTRFQLVANYHEATFAAIQKVCQISSPVTPLVSLEHLYSSKQSGCIDMWESQGWRAKELTNQDVVDACKDAETMIEPRDALDPPRYALQVPGLDDAPSSQDRNRYPSQAEPAQAGHQSLQTSPHLPSTAPPYSTHAEFNPPLVDITCQHSSAATNDSRGSPSLATTTCSAHDDIFSALPSGSSSMPVPASSSGYIATFLSGFPSYSNSAAVIPRGHTLPTSPINGSVQITRAGSIASVRVPATDPKNASPISSGTRGDMMSPVPDSLTRKRRTSRSLSHTMARPATRPCPTNAISDPYSHVTHQSHNILSTTVADSLSYNNGLNESDRGSADHDPCHVSQEVSLVSLWLLKAWEHCPVAHHVTAVELSRLATAISHNTCDEDITTHRVACTLALIDHCTRGGSTNCPHAGLEIECNIMTDLPNLTAWLYNIHPDADMDFFLALSKLSLLVDRLQNRHFPSNDYTNLLRTYKTQKADIVGQACLRYSDELLQQGLESRRLETDREEWTVGP